MLSAPALSRVSPVPFTVNFDADVTGFSLDGVTVEGGAASNFVQVSPRQYTFTVAPASSHVSLVVTVVQGAATDSFGNANLKGERTVVYGALRAARCAVRRTRSDLALHLLLADAKAPTAAVTTTALSPSGTNPIPVTVTFSEALATALTAAGLDVTGGTITLFSAIAGNAYTFGVIPTSTFNNITVGLRANVVTDLAGNSNTKSAVLLVQHGTRHPSRPCSASNSHVTRVVQMRSLPASR
jgi:hypothetical protein